MSGLYGTSGENEDSISNDHFEKLKSSIPTSTKLKHLQRTSVLGIDAASSYLEFERPRDIFFSDQNTYVWVAGEYFNLDEICQKFTLMANSLPELIAYAYNQKKLKEVLAVIDGDFCAVLFDKRTEITQLISDRYGMRLLYWKKTDNKLTWCHHSTPLSKLNISASKISTQSLDCFLSLGYLVGEQTWFEDIKLINPATIITFDPQNNTLKEEKYWSWTRIQTQNISFENAVDHLGQLFIEAVSKRFNLNQKIGVSLSGGLDSRAILAAIHSKNPDYRGVAFTFGVEGSQDEKIAKDVIRLTNWDHHCLHITSKNWFEPRLQATSWTDGMLSVKHMSGIEFKNQIGDLVDININGYAGDAVLGGSLLRKGYFDQKMDQSLAESYYDKFYDFAEINSEFYDIQKIEPHLYMNRVRRFTNMGTSNFLGVMQQRKPFMDNDLIEFVFSLPDSYRHNNRIYSKMLIKFFPVFFKKIPWQSTGHPLTCSPLTYRFQLLKRRLVGKLLKRGSTDFTDHAEWIRTSTASKEISEILKFSSKLPFVNEMAGEYEQLLENHIENRQIDNSELILRAATLIYYLNNNSKN